MKYTLSAIFAALLALSPAYVNAQVSDTFMLAQKLYTSTEEAVGAKDSVYKLMITNEGKVSPELATLPNLRWLWVTGNDWDYALTELPDNIGKLSKVEQFCLYNTNVTAIPPAIKGMKALKRLVCNDVQTLPSEVGDLSQLEELSVPAVKTLPASIGKLAKLKILYIGNTVLPSIASLEELRTSPLTIMQLADPSQFQNLRKLTLYFPNGALNNVIPNDSTLLLMQKIAKFPKLKSLDISVVILTPGAWKILASMTQLTHLEAGSANSVMPPDIAKLVNLEHIRFSPSDLKSCTYLSKLPALASAELLGNITSHVALLAHLRSITLSDFSSLEKPEIEILKKLPALKEIAIKDIWMKFLSSDLKYLTQLESIDLRGANQLFDYPADAYRVLSTLPGLHTLTICDYQLASDEQGSIGNVKGLHTLRMVVTGYGPAKETMEKRLPAGCKMVLLDPQLLY